MTTKYSLPPLAAYMVLAALILQCAGCSTLGGLGQDIVDTGLTPTSQVKNARTERPPAYIPISARPPSPAPDLTAEERRQAEQDLLAARERVRALAAAPVGRSLPALPPLPAAQTKSPASAGGFNDRGIY